MTVAQLKARMDARFNTVDRRFNAIDKRFDAIDKRFDAIDKRFGAIAKTLDAILAGITLQNQHYDTVVDEHDKRLNDLEAWRKTRNGIHK